jgi:hypothetical protein
MQLARRGMRSREEFAEVWYSRWKSAYRNCQIFSFSGVAYQMTPREVMMLSFGPLNSIRGRAAALGDGVRREPGKWQSDGACARLQTAALASAKDPIWR